LQKMTYIGITYIDPLLSRHNGVKHFLFRSRFQFCIPQNHAVDCLLVSPHNQLLKGHSIVCESGKQKSFLRQIMLDIWYKKKKKRKR